MTGLHDHLDRAAGDSGGDHDLDLAALHERAHHRRTRRRAGLAGAAAVVLLAAGGLAWGAASAPDAAQQLAASEGGDGAGGAPETTVASTDTTAGTDTTLPPEPVDPTVVASTTPTTTVPGDDPTTTVPSTTRPGTATTTVPAGEAEATTSTIAGTYAGHEIYRLVGRCPDITHRLEATFTSDRGTFSYVADYCGHREGDTWTASGHGTLTDEDGNQIAVGIDHTAPYPTTGVPYSVTIRGGNGPYAGASGTCDLTVAITNPSFGSQDQSGDFTCEITT